MPTTLDPDFHGKAAGNKQAPRRAAIPFHSARRGANELPPLDLGEAVSAVAYPGFWPRRLAGAGPVFLVAIALLITFYPSLHKKRPAIQATEQSQQLETITQPSVPAPSPAKPSAALAQTRSKALITPERPSHAVPVLPAAAILHDHPMQYVATRKKALGGCTGELELTKAALLFRCSHQADLDIPVSFIAGTHKDGVVLASGEKYHFLIANHTKGQVEMIFSLWLNSARQSNEASRRSSY